MAINANKEDAEVEISPQYLEDFNLADESEDFFNSDDSWAEPILSEKSHEEIIKRLRLDHLNDEEREHVDKLFIDSQEIFGFPGEPLRATDVLLL